MNNKLVISTAAAAIGGLLFGYETAVINGALPFLTQYFELTDFLKGAAVSSALFGSIFGALFIGRPGDKFGRLPMLRLLAVLFFISGVGTGLANDIIILIVFRFIGGIAVGAASVLSPLYIAEISPANLRGRLAISFQLAIVIGILLAFFIDYLLIDTGPNNWRYMLLSLTIPAIIFFILLLFVVKSPRWLVRAGRVNEAKDVVKKLNNRDDVEKILAGIQKSLEDHSIPNISELFKKQYFKYVFIGVAVGMFNQFTGINIIMYYASDIFRSVGFSTNSALGQTVAIGFVNLVFTIIAMRLIDIVGRKKLLLTGTLGMALFLAVFAFSFISNLFPDWASVVLLIGFTAFFASSQGAVIWVLLGEIFPNRIRAMGASIGSFSHWFFNGATTFLFPIIVGLFSTGKGTGYVFAFYAVMTFISYFVFKKYLIEMKGKSLESID